MNQDPLISIIIPVCNTAPYLEKCLRSVREQTYRNTEILAVDDGSTDRSAAILAAQAAEDPRIHVIRRENGGLSAARNTGLDNAKGRYILFVDGDDALAPDALSVSYAAACGADAQLVAFDAEGVMEETGYTYPVTAPLAGGVYGRDDVLSAIASFALPPNVPLKLFAGSLFDGVRFPEGELWEDCAVIHLLAAKAERTCVIHDRLYFYLQRADSITKRAHADLSIYFWRLLQYGRRYAWLLENAPSGAKKAAPSFEEAVFKYAAALACGAVPPASFKETGRALPDGGVSALSSFNTFRKAVLSGTIPLPALALPSAKDGETSSRGACGTLGLGAPVLLHVPVPRTKGSARSVRAARLLLRYGPHLYGPAARHFLRKRPVF